jgi:hypothetical protein
MPPSPTPFPPLDNGLIAHLPLTLTIERLTRGIRFHDGSLLNAASEARLRYNWTLRYENLNTAEWQRILDFISIHGSGAAPFWFADPTGNLLAQSGNLEHSVWITPPGLTVDPFEDPDQPKAFILTNSTSTPLSLMQAVNLPGPFRTCFSVFAKWEGSAGFGLSLADGSNTATRHVIASNWERHAVDLSSNAEPASRTIAIIVPPTTQIIVAAPLLEIAAAPGAYIETGAQGAIFPEAWLTQQSFDSKSNAPGAHSITLRIESLRAL